MSSLFKLNQLTAHKEAPAVMEEPKTALENRDREIYALRQQLQTLKTLFKNAKTQTEASPQKTSSELSEESEHSKQRSEKLMAMLTEREKQIRAQQQHAKQQQALANDEWQKERQAKQIALEEIAALQGQLEFLKTKVTSSQNVLKAQQEQIQIFQEERALAASQLQTASLIAKEKEAVHLENEKLQADVAGLDQRLNAAHRTIQEQEEKLQEKEMANQCHVARLVQLEKGLAAAEQRIQLFEMEKALLQENAFKAQNAQEDAEARLKIAHYHLAKKVKETTLLADRSRELEGQVQELTVDLSYTQEKMLELQCLLEEQFFQEKKRQEHLQDSLKDTELLAEAWEKKYFEIYAKWQEQNEQLKEFKNLEDKLFQMKSLWMSFEA